MTKEKQLNSRQAGYLLFAIITVYKLINLPYSLVEGAGRDGWIGSVFMMAWEGLLVVLFIVMTVKFPGKTIEEILGKTMGRTAVRVVLALFAAFLSVKLYLSLLTTEQFLVTNLYGKINWIPFGLPMMVIIVYAAVKGIRSIGRVAEILGIIILVAMFGGVLAILTQADFSMLLPILHHGPADMLTATEENLMGTSEAIVFLMLLGRVEKKHVVRNLLFPYFFAVAVVVSFNLCFFGFYGISGVHLKYGESISDMLQYMRGADSLARLDIFVVVAILLLSLLKLMTYGWAAGTCIRIAFQANDAHRTRLYAQAPVFVLLCLFDYLLQKDIFNIYNILRGVWKYTLIVPFEIVLPIALIVCAIVVAAREKKRELPLYRRRRTSA